MTPATAAPYDHTALKHVLTKALQLGLLQSALVATFSLVGRLMNGPGELVVDSIIVLVGIAATTILPGVWTRARTVEGIAGAAGIGLAATGVFLLVDLALLQPLGVYTNRWLELGGGSNWWYHPVWWMAGTFLPWMGAYALANQTVRRGQPSPGGVFLLGVVLAVVLGAFASAIGFPGAALGLGTVSVAFLPAMALTVLMTGLGARRA